MMHLFRVAPPVVTLLLLALSGAGALAQDQQSGAGHQEATYRGGMVTPPLPKPKFTLTDTAGVAFDLRKQTDGYITLLFFGYTHCPDVCPMHVSFLAGALRKLPKDLADRFKMVFVTTDPDRDDARTLRAWLDNFDKRFIGLTGGNADIQAAQTMANVPVAQGAPSYGHSSFVLAYTRDNLAHVIYPSGVSQEDWLHDLPQLVTESWGAH